MKLEAGKKYVLRNGSIEKCLAVWCEEVRGYQATVTYRPHGGTEYTIDGKWQCGGEESPFDIVAEYKEPTRVADYLVPIQYSENIYGRKTHPIGQQPEGSVLVPNSERNQE